MKLRNYELPYDEALVIGHLSRQEEFDAYRRLIGFIYLFARKVKTMRVGFDDKLQVGSIGAIQAIRSYKIGSGCKFMSWAKTRIHGAIMDEKRRFDNLICNLRNGSPETVEIEDDIGYEVNMDREDVTRLLGMLNGRAKKIVAMDLMGFKNIEIAERLKKNPSQVSQLRKLAYKRMEDIVNAEKNDLFGARA